MLENEQVLLSTECLGERPWFGKIKHKSTVRLQQQNFGNELIEARADSEWQSLDVYHATASQRKVVVKSGQKKRKSGL